MSATAFILSEDEQIGGRLETDLKNLGLKTRTFRSTNDCIEACGAGTPSVLLAYCGAGECDRLVGQLRTAWQTEEARILLISDLQSIDEFAGAGNVDDLILSTYEYKELALRLKLILSKLNDDDGEDRIVVGQMTIDPRSYEVKIYDRPILLTFREYELLRFLAGRRGRVFTRKTLIENIWQYDYLSGTRTVDVHVRRLRSKLGPLYGALVETVRNVGYRFSRYDPQEARR